MFQTTIRRWMWPAILPLAVSGCYGGLELDADGGGAAGSGGADTDGSDADSGGQVDQTELPAPTTRLFRLTHEQWENTVADLFYLPEPTGFSVGFRADPAESGYMFDNNALGLEVDGALWSGYQRAAADVAELIATDPARVEAITPPDGGDDSARADQFVRDFGMRAFRRPLTDTEVTQFTELFDSGASLYSDLDGFDAGVRIVIETMLQSPHFLYRVERSNETDGPIIRLDDFEVASRLSYFLWNSMPDEGLFTAAQSGELTGGSVEDEARRMLQDPRAIRVVQGFHETIFKVEKYEDIDPSTVFFPDAPATLGESAQEEFRRYIDGVVFEEEGNFADLLTSNRTYVNADLAEIYGIEGNFGSEFEAVDLDPAERRGLLTSVGFLAHNATSVDPDPIHRGVFVAEYITCTDIPAPPDGVPPLPPPEGKSNRQMVTEHTEQPGTSCVGCHASIINPYGFPFENYDATGAFRTVDNGFDVDASATVTLQGEMVQVDNALDLIDFLATHPKVHACYMDHWVQYANGRTSVPEDEPLVDRLAATSTDEAASVQDIIIEIVTSQPFLTRAAEEL